MYRGGQILGAGPKLIARYAATLSVVAMPVGTALTSFPAVASAATVNVTNCNDAGPGSLRSAVAGATSGDTIDFALSPSCGVIALTSGTIKIGTDLTIEGPGSGALAVSGNNAHTVLLVSRGATVTISGLTVEDGQSYAGAGIINDGTLILTDSTVSNNGGQTSQGGGIDNGGTLTLAHDTLSGNGATTGGGIDSNGTLTVINSTFSQNRASSGGGAIASGGPLTVTNSVFSGNSALNVAGGAISVGTGAVQVDGSTFTGNSAVSGGGIFFNTNNPGPDTVADSLFSDNAATGGTNTGGGGGILNAGKLTVTNTTLWQNNANDGGGGISNLGILTLIHATLSDNAAPAGFGSGIFTTYDATTTLNATIVANNGAGRDCHVEYNTPSRLFDSGYNLDDDGSCGLSSTNHSLPDTPAGLALSPAANGGSIPTIRLVGGSAAIDYITSAPACIATSQPGARWPVPCNIGVLVSHVSTTGLNPNVSTIASSLLGPFEAFKPLTTDVVDAGVAVGAVLFIAFPAQIFNYTFRENYAEIRKLWPGFLRRRRKRQNADRVTRNWTRRLGFTCVVLLGGWLSGLNDPHFGLRYSSLITYLAVVGSITVGAAVPGLVGFAYHRLRHGSAEAFVYGLPAGLAIAAGCVLVSRLSGFQPGYLYGVVLGVKFSRELAPPEKGRVMCLTTLGTLAVAVGAWFAWVPVNHAAERPGTFTGLALLDDLLAAVFVSGLVGTVVGLIPLRFLPGHVIKDWRRTAWAVVFGAALLCLIQVMIRPHGAHPHHTPMIVTIGLFVAFGVSSLVFRDYFDRKHRRAHGESVPPLIERLRGLASTPHPPTGQREPPVRSAAP